MWNSPNRKTEAGKRYRVEDLTALILPIEKLLDFSETEPIADLVGEKILGRMERGEFVFTLFQVFEALLEEVEVPKKGHSGVQEAMISELLDQSFVEICGELENAEFGHHRRESVWGSVERLLIRRDGETVSLPWILEEIDFAPLAPEPYLSPQLDRDVWEELLIGESGLWAEFLWDTDWQMDALMDLPPDGADQVTKMLGMDLEVTQALPDAPSRAELKMAEHYLRFVSWKDEVIRDRAETGESQTKKS